MTVRRRLTPYLLLAPSLAFLALFFAVPMFQAFALALQDSSGAWSLSTLRDALGEPRFLEALRTTVLLLVLILPVQFALAMSMALIVNAGLKGRDLWLYVFAIPLGVSELAAGIIWFAIFTEQGWLNSVLTQLGLVDRPVLFLNYQNTILLVVLVVVAEAWRATSIMMIVLVAGLQAIPREVLEAADVYGASTWRRVRFVILPMLKPTIRVALVLRAILAFQVFASVIAITGRGMTVLANETYRSYSEFREPRTAAAYAAVILLLSLVTVGVIFAAIRTPEERVGT